MPLLKFLTLPHLRKLLAAVTPRFEKIEHDVEEINLNILSKTNIDSYTPTSDYHPATKKYVDDSIPAPDIFWVNIGYTSGSGDQAIYTADKSYDEVYNAINNGKYVVANDGGQIYYWDGYYYTSFVNNEGSYYLRYFSYINADTNNTLYASVYSWADASSMQNKANVWDVLTKTNTTSYTPTANYHPATKKYVDDAMAAIPNEVLIVTFTYDRYENSSYVYIADKSNTEITNAYSAGKIVMGKMQDGGAYLFNGGGFFATQPDEDYPIISYFYYYGSDYEYSGDFISLIDSNRFYNSVLTKTNTDVYTPTSNYNPATKKYVDDSIGSITVPTASTTTPLMDGTAAIGSSTNYAKADHVHPSDTSKLTRHVSQNGGLEHSTISNLYNQFTVQVANDGGGLVNNFTLTPTSTTINNVVTPTSDGMAANKKYVDDAVAAVDVPSEVVVVTITISTVDGETVYTADKTYSELREASIAGKNIILKHSIYTFYLWAAPKTSSATTQFIFGTLVGGNEFYFTITSNNVVSRPTLQSVRSVNGNTGAVSLGISDMNDATVSNPANGQVLTYDSTSSKWINSTPSSGVTETRVNELIAAALAQYGDGDTATYGYTDASEVNY